ncbi:hypothetical protein GCM10027446_05050 [Angustibacter peucedani]
MSKRGILKISGFVGTVGAGAALVAAAAGGTGAWFTDSKDGSFTASSGHLTLNTTDRTLSFNELVPGEYKTRTIDYNVDASGQSDVWLVFDQANPGVAAFTGSKDGGADGGLGRYGHFEVWNGGQQLFTSYNLQHKGTSGVGDSCGVDADGHGGSNQQATSPTDTPPYCGVPYAIKIASNLSSGQGGTMSMVFGVTGKWRAQNTPVASVPFKVVATQAGHRPDAANF